MISRPHSNWLICKAVNHSDVPNYSFTGKVVNEEQCLSLVLSSLKCSISNARARCACPSDPCEVALIIVFNS